MSSCEHTSEGSPFVCARCTRAATSSGPGAQGGTAAVFTAPRTDAGRAAMAEHLDGHSDVGRRPGWLRRRGA